MEPKSVEILLVQVENQTEEPDHRHQSIVKCRESEVLMPRVLDAIVIAPPVRVLYVPALPRLDLETEPWYEHVHRTETWVCGCKDRPVLLDVPRRGTGRCFAAQDFRHDVDL